MQKTSLLALCFMVFSYAGWAQGDTLAAALPEEIASASPQARAIVVDMSNPEEMDLALKKIHTFRYLESLTLEGEPEEGMLSKLFYRLSVLRNIEHLTLSENELTTIPESISTLKTLRTLTIEGNANLGYNELFVRLRNIPVAELNLIDNDLKQAPAGIGELTSLRKLQVSGSNQLDYTALVDYLAKLPLLTKLSLAVNYISELPGNIDKLRALQLLDVSNNNLTELPPQISALKAINNLSIQGNLLFDPAKDLEKLKGNNIQYLSLDKEISGDELEKIKKMFPAVQIEFPLSKEEDETAETKKISDTQPKPGPAHSGELKTKKEARILSAAYLLYPTLFQGLVYNYDTLGFDERYRNLRYTNIYQMVNAANWSMGSFYLRTWLIYLEQPGKKNETWFRLARFDLNISRNYSELRAFTGMYWVYKGNLSKKQFRKTYLVTRVRSDRRNAFGLKGRKRKTAVKWNDVRIDFDKNNSLFTFELKGDTGFSKFTAYPLFANVPLETSQRTYQQRYLQYKKTLMRRAQRFKKDQGRAKARYDLNFKKMQDYAWKELQLRMSDDEKAMSKEDWLAYYDAVIGSEQKALDNSALSATYIIRSLMLRGYNVAAPPVTNTLVTNNRNPAPVIKEVKNYAFKTIAVDFTDAESAAKLPVTSILIIDNKKKRVSQTSGTLGMAPNVLTMQQYAGCTILVELRNGSWGRVSAMEIDKQAFEPGRVYQFSTTVIDKNLGTIGELLKDLAK